MKVLQPAGWKRPKGYANGVIAAGRLILVAGQIGWDADEVFVSEDFAGQARQALKNVVAVLKEAGAGPRHLVKMTWFVTDKREYKAASRELGAIWREVIGDTYPAMSLVEVKSLLEDRAKVEIEAFAVLP
jgi:enamine deaminase RidA (YjgF/YER057c/UK114 family)